MTLKTFNGMLPEGKFLRIHRSFLIPAWRIESRSALSVRLVGVDRDIPVGSAHKENLK
jgi:DNA-binding LytR/AlgR family response regulator